MLVQMTSPGTSGTSTRWTRPRSEGAPEALWHSHSKDCHLWDPLSADDGMRLRITLHRKHPATSLHGPITSCMPTLLHMPA